MSQQQPTISDNDIVAIFHKASLEQAKAFEMMHNSFLKISEEYQTLKQDNQKLAEKILKLSEVKVKKDD